MKTAPENEMTPLQAAIAEGLNTLKHIDPYDDERWLVDVAAKAIRASMGDVDMFSFPGDVTTNEPNEQRVLRIRWDARESKRPTDFDLEWLLQRAEGII